VPGILAFLPVAVWIAFEWMTFRGSRSILSLSDLHPRQNEESQDTSSEKLAALEENDDPTIVSGQAFNNECVLLDGHYYMSCEFTNVTLVYDGRTQANFVGNKFIGSIRLSTSNYIVASTIAVIAGLGWLKEDIPLILPPGVRNPRPIKNP
jgi:hypothetical protein